MEKKLKNINNWIKIEKDTIIIPKKRYLVYFKPIEIQCIMWYGLTDKENLNWCYDNESRRSYTTPTHYMCLPNNPI